MSRNFGPEWPAMKTAEAAHRRGTPSARRRADERHRDRSRTSTTRRSPTSATCPDRSRRPRAPRWISTGRAATTASCSARPTAIAQVYQSLLAQQKELPVVANSRANNVQVMERAEVPKFADLAQPAPGLDHRDPGGSDGRDRPRLRDRVSGRHGQDAGRHHAPAQAAAARPGAGGPRRARAGADRGRAARFRRSVPLAAHVARVHQRRASGRGSSRVTSSQPLEGKTTTACEPGDGARARRLARAAHRRRHAAAGSAQDAGAREQHRAVAPAGRARRASARRFSGRPSRTSW